MAKSMAPRRNQDLDIRAKSLMSKLIETTTKKRDDEQAFANWVATAGTKEIEKIIKKTKELAKTEAERYQMLRDIDVLLQNEEKMDKKILKLLKEERVNSLDRLKNEKQIAATKDKVIGIMKKGNALLQQSLATNKEIFNISHQMQLDSNVTWENYSKLYAAAYESTRDMNKEIGQSVHNIKDLIVSQEKLLGDGWRNMKPADLNAVAASTMTLAKTLGSMPAELSTAFQNSYRIFGTMTDTFVTAIGNRLNAFSDTFGVSLGMLSGAVADMMDSNNFISRSNMNAQIQANENLMRAAALSASVGLTQTSFLTDLAKVTQFGTIEQMSSIYEGGALLEGFNTDDFQNKMQGQDYAGATSDLFGSIQQTLNGIDDQYLRAEYMDRIGGTFGLSQDELLRIATNGGNLDAYEEDMASKLVDVNTSMVDELTDLKVSWIDRFDNWLDAWGPTEKIGKFFQDMGLYGIEGFGAAVIGQLGILIAQNSLNNGLLSKAFTSKTAGGMSSLLPNAGSTTGGLSGIGIAGTMGGLALGAGANVLGSNMISNGNTTAGYATNVLGGAAGGALAGASIGSMLGGPGIGTLIGAGVGLGAGIISSEVAKNKRESAVDQMRTDEDNARREAAKAQSNAKFLTGDPIVDAINKQTDILASTLNENYEENRRTIMLNDAASKTSAAID